MRIAYYDRFGATEVLHLGRLDCPEPGPGEVRVRIISSGVNPYDVKFRAGLYASAMPFPRIVPHCDGAGVIDAVGPGVTDLPPGTRVWLWNAQFQRPFGTAADFTVLPAAQVAPLPDPLSFDEGACLGVPYFTAYQAVLYDGPVAGQTVLVSGGGGSVGQLAVAVATAMGARVIATASSPERAALARASGAEAVIDHKRDDVAEAVRGLTGGQGADRLVEVEFGLNLPLFTRLLRPGGAVFSYGSAQAMTPVLDFKPINNHGLTLHFRSVFRMDEAMRRRAVDALPDLAAGRRVVPSVGRCFALEAIAEAHAAVEQGRSVGNTVIRVGEAS